MLRFLSPLFLCAAVLSAPLAAAAQPLKLVVGGANFRPFPIAAPGLVPADGGAEATAKSLTTTLHDGLDLVRAFELVPVKSYLAPDKEPVTAPIYANWQNIGASGLIRGTVAQSGAGSKITLRYFDVFRQREVLSRNYDAAKDGDGRRAVHRFLDDLLKELTGEAGLFSTRIAYVKRTKSGRGIFVSDIDGENVTRVTTGDELSVLPAFDNSGRYVLFTSFKRDNPDLYRVRLPDGAPELVSGKQGINTGAAVSADGKRIALTLSFEGNADIYVMKWNGEGLTRLTDGWGEDVSPTWSPDGKRIAFVSSRSGQPHLYVMNADGSAQRRLTFQGDYNQEPDWSPRADGQIVFTARDERIKYDLFLVHPDSGAITRLTQDEGNNDGPSFSPDGHSIVFASTRGGGGKKLFVMDADGNNPRRISKEGGEHETPAWGPRLGW